uniref:universal stress protein n=1 Tax=Ningiella ruwaisensis TaxID=2364274 RepID=UPI0014461F3C|nr:universal stress protein [Ningiella ruwaisensis]
MSFRNIVFVSTGLLNDQDALKSALTLASRSNSNLSIILLLPGLPDNLEQYAEQFMHGFIDECQSMVDKVKSSMDFKGDITITTMDNKRPALSIIKAIIRHKFDLVVKQVEASSHNKGFKALDMDLLRKCPCPLMLCREKHQLTNAKLAVAIDPESEDDAGNQLSQKLLTSTQDLLSTDSGRYELISCWDFTLESSLNHGTWLSLSAQELQAEKNNAQKNHFSKLKKIVDDAEQGDHANIHHIEGLPFEAIPNFVANENIDLLVMGTVARTGIAGFIIGNTAENILQSLECSLLAMKPDGFVCPVDKD